MKQPANPYKLLEEFLGRQAKAQADGETDGLGDAGALGIGGVPLETYPAIEPGSEVPEPIHMEPIPVDYFGPKPGVKSGGKKQGARRFDGEWTRDPKTGYLKFIQTRQWFE